MWATDYRFDTREDVYPIKSYIDFELDKDPKEELKVEPFASVLEVLGAMSREEQVWIQIVFRGYFGKATSKDSWQVKVMKEVDKIRDAASKGITLGIDDPEDEQPGFPRPTHAQTETMRNMERNISKLIFDVGMRGMYIAPAGKGRSAEYSAYRWIWRPFNNPNFQNGLRPSAAHNDFDYLWQDWNGVRWNLVARRYFDAFRRRQYFHAPWQMPFFRMSTESLATIWHPPSRTVAPQGLQRIPVKKSTAPVNLPM